jgi:hypothetical protein
VGQRDRLFHRLHTVAERRLEIDETFDLCSLRRLDDIDAADNVGQRIGIPVLRILVGGGRVHDDIRQELAEGTVHEVRIGNRAFAEHVVRRFGRQVFRPARGEIIEAEHGIPARQHQLGNMRTDLARCARNQDFEFAHGADL